jgi:DNA-binding LacI/PurR family transcriptional regulator
VGRRRIAFFGDPELPEVGHRYEGYRQALAQHGVPLDGSLVRRAAFVETSAQDTVESLCAERVVFDAIFASSDLLAIRAIRALRDQGLSVPHDIAVVGYDDIELAQYVSPSLTTVRQPVAAGAVALVDALLALIEGGQPDPSILPTTLIVRDSSAARTSDSSAAQPSGSSAARTN